MSVWVLEPVPGPLDHVEGVPLGDALLDPTGQDVRGIDDRTGEPAAGAARTTARAVAPRPGRHADGLVGRPQRDSVGLQLVLDHGAEVGAAGDAVDLLADDRDEPAAGRPGLGEQVVDPAVTRDRDLQAGRTPYSSARRRVR